MKKRKLLSVLFAFSLILGMLAACSNSSTQSTNTTESNNNAGQNQDQKQEEKASNEPRQGGSLVLGTTGSPTLFNAYYSTDGASRVIENLIFSGLVTINREFKPEGDVAESWDVTDDGLKWTFKIRQGMKFHDGHDLTADDVIFSYSLPLNEDYTGPYGLPFKVIKEINKVDDYTVEFVLTEPYAPFITITATMGVLPKHLLEDVPVAELGKHEFNTKNPIGSGPFKFSEWKDGQYVKVDAFDDYYEGRPYLDSIIYKIVPDANAIIAQLQAGDITYTGITPSNVPIAQKMADEGKLELKSGVSNAWDYIGYNLRNPLFQDKSVRQALTHAIDRESIVAAVLDGAGQVTHGPGSPANWAFTEDVPKFEFDPSQSSQMLDEAGWKKGADGILEKDGKKFSFTLTTTSSSETYQQIATVVQQQLAEVGIEVKIELLEWSAYLEATQPPNWKFDAIVAGWSIGSDPDPTYFWHSKEIEQGLNYFAFSNPKVDELLDMNTKVSDIDERKAVISEAEKIITEEQPYTFLYNPMGYIGHSPKLHGPEFSVANSYYDIHKWWLEE
ncbi:peptide-binding protein [Bacillus sp. DTU_2020_1000418_1_SI_GHA_SEK_038]|uniref:peptide-binding protein n=1 Tax=Bacillus sp. DTU_2020_1000418_1_SI_GHA_SEK_038 TaxID=3077585 RepID=UPI0028E95FBE|nr:peptide-binding protein [Bacillus sp. DTU_2020_1000418_1_SI_GHA_SEK_038]WNS74734.1 peptide-binding protein [Bacillus sp. DTU_2020_1000418_1_SI_GHA_SEK_038]